jgi:hypothetical protein
VNQITRRELNPINWLTEDCKKQPSIIFLVWSEDSCWYCDLCCWEFLCKEQLVCLLLAVHFDSRWLHPVALLHYAKESCRRNMSNTPARWFFSAAFIPREFFFSFFLHGLHVCVCTRKSHTHAALLTISCHGESKTGHSPSDSASSHINRMAVLALPVVLLNLRGKQIAYQRSTEMNVSVSTDTATETVWNHKEECVEQHVSS